MKMFCYQCQETVKNSGCTMAGACGKKADTANLQDLLIYTLKGVAFYEQLHINEGNSHTDIGAFITDALFSTITNANFDNNRFIPMIKTAIKKRDSLKEQLTNLPDTAPDAATWDLAKESDLQEKASKTGVLSTENEDLRSLRELLIYGLKGIAAYASHAAALNHFSQDIYTFVCEALTATIEDRSAEEMTELVLRCGKIAVDTMALLDKANTETYGNPEITEVNIGVGKNPGILISGHDLKDMEELLKQTEGTGVDIYTHSEMLPANYYPAFKKYKHFVGNYGNAWWKQNSEFESFNGPILMTTNCITPVKESYKERFFTTGMAGYPGMAHIPESDKNGAKDFSQIIELAKKCQPPKEIETGFIIGGFAHHQVLALADKVVEAVKSGAIKRFVVMAGCDGRHTTRDYFSEVAQKLPQDTIILTAGCAKYRYNKLNLGDIDGIPRVLDAGQCNDSYSLAVIALKLKEVFGAADINELPISFDIAWYEQKAVAVLLALLHLGVKGIRLGPTLPAFLSPNVVKILVENFNIKPISNAETDVAAIMKGE